jgi:hypothetical protein
MEPLEFIKKAEDGKIVIEVPKYLNGRELKITVTEQEKRTVKKFRDMTPEERAKELMKYCGTAKYPDVDLDKYNVYEQ